MTALEARAGAEPTAGGRLLVVDDNPAIHEDFRKILGNPDSRRGEFERLDRALFEHDAEPARERRLGYELDVASQGHEGLARVQAARDAGRPYALAFVDVRMPPGWNGVETAARMLDCDSHLQVVLCTAYSDFGWEQIVDIIGVTDRVLLLKKPFSVIEVQQLAYSLVNKWRLLCAGERHRELLEARVETRTAELSQANALLREEIAERTRVEEALRKAQRLEALGRLAAGIGHEINNPLNFISGSVEILQRELDAAGPALPAAQGERIHEVLETAAVGVDRIASIVRSIKLFSRPDSEPVRPVDLAETLALCVKMSASRLDDAVAIALDTTDVPLVLGKRVELEQVFINLLENAGHALRDAGVEAPCIRVAIRAEGSHTVRVDVADNGPGIPPEVLDKVFEPFVTTKAPGIGTGLGLSICHSIVSGMQGEIRLRNRPEGGAVASVRLPAASLQAGAGEARARSGPGRDEPAPEALRGRVLIIDDEPLMLRVMVHTLREHELVTVQSAREALARYAEAPFDVIFCDVMMPGMNGRAFYEALARAHPGHEGRVVFITGGPCRADIQAFLDSAPNDCLEKPVPIETLRARVQRALAERAATGL